MQELSGYNCGGYDCDIADTDAVLPLDPIEREVVGALRLSEVLEQMRSEFPSWASVLRRIFDGDVGFQYKHQTRLPVVAKKYRAHMEHLQDCGILVFAYVLGHDSPHRWISGYFSVRKGCLRLSRSIFNGRALSLMCRPPPPVNLLELRTLLREASNHVGNFFMLDLRHWFHQVRWSSVGEGLRKLFTIVYEGLAYSWDTLPMGWSYSPFICEMLAWFLVLHLEPGERALFRKADYLNDHGGLPTHVHIQRPDGSELPIGFVSITYDNVGVFCSDCDTCLKIKKRVLRNLTLFGALVKEESVGYFSAKDMAEHARSPKRPEYLGLSLGVRTTAGERSLIWKVSEQRMKEWENSQYSNRMTRRRVAQWCGRILRHHYISLKPLFQVEEVIAVVRELGKQTGTRRELWNEMVTVNAESVEFLQAHWKNVLRDAWHTVRVFPASPSLIVFTDASGWDGWGFVIADLSGQILFQRWCAWKEHEVHLHIFIKETWATAWAAKCVRRRFSTSHHLIFALDNVPSRQAIQRGYSSNRIANQAIKTIYESISELEAEFRGIPGRLNPANEPSHRLPVDERKLAVAIQAVMNPSGAKHSNEPPDANRAGLRQNIDDVAECEEEEGAILIEALLRSFEDETESHSEVKQTCT